MKNILVLCTGNSCRSQIAEAYLRFYAQGKANIYSAGIETHGVNPMAIATLLEDGIDISHHTSNNVNEYKDLKFSHVITVCDNANEHCPVYLGETSKLHHNFTDPAKARGTWLELQLAFAKVRDEIKAYCKDFCLNID